MVSKMLSWVSHLGVAASAAWKRPSKLSLLRSLVQRDLESRYKGSILGNFWPVVTQLSQLLIYTYVFSIILKVRAGDVSAQVTGNDSLNYGFWLFSALIVWFSFVSGLSRSTGIIVSQANLVKKVVFPLELLPLVPVLATFLESMLGLVILVIMAALMGGIFNPTLALLPLVWIPQLLLTAGLAYFTSSLTVFLRDIPQSIGIILNLWFYATPILYPASAIPEPFRSLIFYLNPCAALTAMNRDLILIGTVHHWQEWGIASFISLMVFTAGYAAYQKLRPAFADVL